MRKMILTAAVAGLLVGCQTNKTDERRLDNASMSPESRMALLPPEVRASVARDYPGARVQKVVKESYKGGVEHWEVTMVDADGKTIKREYTASGAEAQH